MWTDDRVVDVALALHILLEVKGRAVKSNVLFQHVMLLLLLLLLNAGLGDDDDVVVPACI